MSKDRRNGTATGFAIILGAATAAGLTPRPTPAQTILDKAERDELAFVAMNDPVMAAAIRKARAALPEFLALAQNPTGKAEGFAVKVAVRDRGGEEYFWIHPFEQRGRKFTGLLNNTPRALRTVRAGDKITFTESEIVDWMYMDGGAMKGNYSARALLKSAPASEREAFRKRFGLDPDF